ncbi:hypothetical protein LMG1866_04588 [Achromobacter ruhlandii]|nr:hypothetical protein LMG1866_04588 [Achromobacter ruhlandii]
MHGEPMKKNLRRCLCISAALIGLGVSHTASAVDDVFPAMAAQMQQSASNVANQLVPYALRLLGVLFLIQFALRNYKTAFSVDDPKQLLAKLVFPMLWLGFLMYLIGNSYSLLNAIFSSFLALGRIASGGVDLQPGNIMWNGIALQNNMVIAYNEATGASDGLLNAFKYFFPSMMLSVACLAILLSFFMIALAVAIATLEFFLILAAAPIAFAMGGLEALKQSSIAPLQTMLSIGYRLIILGVIVGVMNDQLVPWSNNFKTVTASNLAPIWIVVFGCLLGAVASFSAGKIAGALASGQSNISGNEAMFAGLQMMQTIATTMTAAASAGQLAGGVADAASKGAGGAGAAAGRGFANLSDALGGGSGSISSAGNGANNSSGAGGQGRAAGMNSADAAQSVLGPMGGDPVGASDQAGDASDAGVSGGSASSEAGGGATPGSAGQASTSGDSPPATPQTSEDRMSQALDNMAEAMRGQRPGTGTQLGRAAMGSVQGMQHDSGHVQVHVDTHSRD